jgi:hypothetical protein
MKPINIKTATEEQHAKLKARAKSVGKTVTQFIKDWIDDDFKVRK